MKLIPESNNLKDYLAELDVVNYSHPLIKEKVNELFNDNQTETQKVKIAFEFVRDKIFHSWDIQSTKITCKADEVLKYQEGLCFAKSNLLAALLRAEQIPTGFCYQRLMIFDIPDKVYSLHALNAVFLKSSGHWIRIDARGNKPGVQAEFFIQREKLAYSINEELDEKDYPIIYAKPNNQTIATLETNTNAIEMCKNHLPSFL